MKYFILIIMIAATGFGGCSNESPQSAKSTDPAPPMNTITLSDAEMKDFNVEFGTAEVGAMQQRIVVPASVVFDQDRVGKATTLIAGRIRSVMADYGDAVSKGQVLATIESVEFGRMIADALRLQSEMETAKSEFERARNLHSESITSDKLYRQAESAYKSAKAQADGARHQLAAAGMTQSEIKSLFTAPDSFQPYLNIVAPISGTVIARNASPGTMVHPEQELFTLVNNARVTVKGNIFQEELALLHPGMVATFSTNAFPEQVFPGKVSEVSAALDEETHTLPVWCNVPNPGGKLKPNLKGELTIETGAFTEALNIPAAALIYDGNDTYVFRDAGNGRLDYVQVNAGPTYGSAIAITDGLRAGDRIATSGVFMLKSKYKLSQQEEE